MQSAHATRTPGQADIERLRLQLGLQFGVCQCLPTRRQCRLDGLFGQVDRRTTGLFLVDRQRRQTLHHVSDPPGLAQILCLGVFQISRGWRQLKRCTGSIDDGL